MSEPSIERRETTNSGSLAPSGTPLRQISGDRSRPLEFAELAQGRADVFISLDGEIYRLLRTKNHKLILTK